ncbi:MAG: LuxR C-terminal-related transcriptional regulator [Alistipes sp.]
MRELRELEDNLLGQNFAPQQADNTLEQYLRIAAMYAQVENSIAVLSDLKANKSYIFNGAFAEVLGLDHKNSTSEIDSIFEEEIYNRIHPDDIVARHILELKFFCLLKKTPLRERINFRTSSLLRMVDNKGVYIPVLHRTFYLCNQDDGAMWIALCLYNYASIAEPIPHFEGIIQNSATGALIKETAGSSFEIISAREKEVLQLIELGFSSKQIALKLNISKNTVDRHRQNMMDKLRVGNSMEAIRVARELGLMPQR